MAGLYVHIPFCAEKCSYCDFFSGNQLYLLEDYILALSQEILSRKSYLNEALVTSVYLGGGTPSLLSKEQLMNILTAIRSQYELADDAEITIECNPENIHSAYVYDLLSIGINRISLGIQFMRDDILAQFNRKHTKDQIIKALDSIGFHHFPNLSVDLIYAVPGIGENDLLKTLELLSMYDIKHFSAYNLTIAKNTKLFWQVQSGKIIECQEDSFLEQYQLIDDFLTARGFSQYEVSNYAKEGYLSKHNMGYWNQTPYLGLGVSAHSFNLSSRQWNHTNIKEYIRNSSHENWHFNIEYLTEIQQYNEYIILRLRTFLGLSYSYIGITFSGELEEHFRKCSSALLKKGHFYLEGDLLIPSKGDLLVADYLAKNLMY